VDNKRQRWALFDLDGTMYPRSAGVFDVVSQRIVAYMEQRLGMDKAMIQQLRTRYMQQYGTSMRGLMLDYGIDPDDYLTFVHDVPIRDLLAPNPVLQEVVARLPWRKVIFTNATRSHVQGVLMALGIDGQFERVFDIADVHYVSKPDPAAYCTVLQAIGVAGEECIAIDDSLPNLRTARQLGMETVWVGSTEAADGADWAIQTVEDIAQVACRLEPGRLVGNSCAPPRDRGVRDERGEQKLEEEGSSHA
jgi:putative hydrolase of the HAD superfamily